jgi:predicted O-methyltransferase YrrM
MDVHSPKTILEIGRNRGHSFGLFGFLVPDAHIVSVDPKRFPEADQVAAKLCGDKDKYEFVDGTINSVDLEKHEDGFDFVLIDGDHRYRGVKHDWDMVSKHFTKSTGTTVVFDNLFIPAVRRVFDAIGDTYTKVRPCDVPGMNDKGTFGVVYVV